MLTDKKLIQNWLDKYSIKNTTVNDDFTVDVDGEVDLSGKNLENLEIKFNRVLKYFDISNNRLTSLYGCPDSIGTNFICHSNQLSSLKYSPNTVGGYFDCQSNGLKSLKGATKIVNGFYCSYNELTELKHCPDTVYGDFVCCHNPIIDILDFHCALSGDFFHYTNQDFIKSLQHLYIENEDNEDKKENKFLLQISHKVLDSVLQYQKLQHNITVKNDYKLIKKVKI